MEHGSGFNVSQESGIGEKTTQGRGEVRIDTHRAKKNFGRGKISKFLQSGLIGGKTEVKKGVQESAKNAESCTWFAVDPYQ